MKIRQISSVELVASHFYWNAPAVVPLFKIRLSVVNVDNYGILFQSVLVVDLGLSCRIWTLIPPKHAVGKDGVKPRLRNR